METDSAGQDSDDFRVCSHLRRKEDHRYEYEQWGEHIHEVRNEVQVVVHYDGFQRCFLCHEVVNLLTDVEDYDDSDDQEKCHEERRDELGNYVNVYFSWSEIHISIVL